MNRLLHVLGWAILVMLMACILGMVYIAVGLCGTLIIVGGSAVFVGALFLGMWLISR